MADCLISPVKEIGKCIWPFLKPHVDYWWCFDSNIRGLDEEVGHLDRQRRDLEQKIEEDRFGTETRPLVVAWLLLASETLEEGRRISQDDNIPKAWKIFSRYSTGKRAKKTAEEIANRRNEGDFNTTADPAPQPAMKYPFHGSTVALESRKSIEKDIIDSLKKSSVDMIGICGMGGVGKTTMARRIENSVKEENLFDEVVWVTVSQTMDLPKIQNEIAHSLNLKIDESNMAARVNQLRSRLMDEKRKLIIFDDVWDSLQFEDFGFPIECNFESCKVLLTSRSRNTCNPFKNKVVFDLESLGEKEAWILFKDKAGKCVEDSALLPVARDVAKECNGLPIALVTLGMALQGVENIQTWRNSLSELKQCNPKDLSDVLKYVYKPLKLSYDYLKRNSERDLLLMCCLFREDYDIPIEQLTWYRMGLQFQLLGGITNIEEARNQTHTWVENLKSRSLLIAGWHKLYVKMHDLVSMVS